MVASVPVLYQPSQIRSLFEAGSEARKWSERLTQNLVVMNGGAAVAVLGLLWAGIVLPFDRVVFWYLALFVLGLSCSMLAMLNDLAKLHDHLPFEQSRWLTGLKGMLKEVDSFWLLFFGLFSFVLGAACALIALSTSTAVGMSTTAPAAGPAPPALTQAAVGYWESELVDAMLAGDRGLFLASCVSLTELEVRPGICDLSHPRR